MEQENPATLDWSLPLEKLPEQIQLSDLPPVFRLIVERNVELRRRIRDYQQKLSAANANEPLAAAAEQRYKDNQDASAAAASRQRGTGDDEASAMKIRELETTIEELRGQIAVLEGKLENFRGMIERRNARIEKLEKKR